MISFTAPVLRFEKQGEKTGWTYIQVPADLAEQLCPGNKKSFRVKGRLDAFPIRGVALMPMGDGSFILALNAEMRKGTGKRQGATIILKLELDTEEPPLCEEFIDCLQDEPPAMEFFQTLNKGHQRYFSRWIESAKTDATKAKRIAQAVSALARGWGYNEMIRAGRKPV